MAKKPPSAPDPGATAETQTGPVLASAPVVVCVGGYNHAAVQVGDRLEIAAKGLPNGFTLAGVAEGYFPGEFRKSFEVKTHFRDEQVLRLKIAILP